MKNPKDLSELLKAQINGENVTFTPKEKTLTERAQALLDVCLKEINENCYMGDGYLIPAHTSQRFLTLNLMVDLAEAIEGKSSI